MKQPCLKVISNWRQTKLFHGFIIICIKYKILPWCLHCCNQWPLFIHLHFSFATRSCFVSFLYLCVYAKEDIICSYIQSNFKVQTKAAHSMYFNLCSMFVWQVLTVVRIDGQFCQHCKVYFYHLSFRSRFLHPAKTFTFCN